MADSSVFATLAGLLFGWATSEITRRNDAKRADRRELRSLLLKDRQKMYQQFQVVIEQIRTATGQSEPIALTATVGGGGEQPIRLLDLVPQLDLYGSRKVRAATAAAVRSVKQYNGFLAEVKALDLDDVDGLTEFLKKYLSEKDADEVLKEAREAEDKAAEEKAAKTIVTIALLTGTNTILDVNEALDRLAKALRVDLGTDE